MSPEQGEEQARAALPTDVGVPASSAEVFSASDLARLVAELSEAVRAHLDSLGNPEGPGR